MRFGSSQVLTTGSMSGNIFSQGIDTSQVWAFSFQALYSGIGATASALGDMKVQVSNDNPSKSPLDQESDPAARVTNWTTYVSGSTTVAVGSSSAVFNIQNPGFRWARFAFTNSSGFGIMSVNYFGKGA